VLVGLHPYPTRSLNPIDRMLSVIIKKEERRRPWVIASDGWARGETLSKIDELTMSMGRVHELPGVFLRERQIL
jgi:hypothetical protein